jgi:hypothetical protein
MASATMRTVQATPALDLRSCRRERVGNHSDSLIGEIVGELSYLLRDREWMLFVDGENFTRRGQEILKSAGVKPDPGSLFTRQRQNLGELSFSS